MGSQPTQGRRRLFHKLLAFAGLGITGVLLLQEKTGLLPPVYANTASYSDTASPVLGVTNTSASSPWTAILGVSQGIGVAGYSSGSSSTSIGVQGTAGSTTAIPIVAYGASGQTGDLQQWQVAGTVKSKVNASGAMIAPTASYSDTTSPVLNVTNTSASSPWTAIVGSSQGIGVAGYSSGSSSTSIGVLGTAGSTTAKPIVAQGTSGQTSNLQEWQKSDGTALTVVDKDGQLGVGIAAPARQVHIRGNNAVARLDRDVDSASFIFTRTAAGNFNTVWKSFTFGVKATGVDTGSFFIGDMHTNVTGSSDNRLLIDTSGNVGIGTTPSSKLHVAGRVKALGYDTGDITYANGMKTTEEGTGLAFLNDAGEKIAVLDRQGNFHIKGKFVEDL